MKNKRLNSPILPEYYKTNAEQLGWGQGVVSLDTERIDLINKYIMGKSILDIGCGYGNYVDYLTNSGYLSYGIDYVDEFIKYAKKNKNGIFIKANAENTGFEDEAFDTVILFDLLEHVNDLKVLTEAKRICKKRILVIVPRIVDRELQNSGVVYRHYIDKSHLREYNSSQLKILAKKTNLDLQIQLKIHPINIDTLFLSMYTNQLVTKKIIRKIINIFLKQKKYYTEHFIVLDKK